MRSYLILKDKARRWNADAEIQALLAEINADNGSMTAFRGPFTEGRHVKGIFVRSYGIRLPGLGLQEEHRTLIRRAGRKASCC